jgi:2'-5' RNA ligase
MPRLFAGLELSDEVRDQLARLKTPLPGAKWVDPANYHITLRFAGDISPMAAREFASSLDAIDADSFTLRVAGLGAFGGNAPTSLWAGIEPNPALEALQRATERAARTAGLAPEGRNFKPHITLARLKHTGPDILARVLQRHGGFNSDPYFVGRFVLFSARPQTGGGPYVVEHAYALRGGSLDNFASLQDQW